MKQYSLFIILLLSLFLTNCGGGEQYEPPKRTFFKPPLDNHIRDLSNEPTYSIILYDMDVDETQKPPQYLHKYRIITQKDSTFQDKITNWEKVSEDYFFGHENDMGMEVASKKADGTVNKTPTPPGFNEYVGNEKYGKWQRDDSGRSFWVFYGQYAMLRSLFGYGAYPVYRTGWNDYDRNYRGSSKRYYGEKSSTGGSRFGTNSAATKKANPNFFERKKTKSGLKKPSTASRYSSSGKKSTKSTKSRYGSSSKKTRSSSRWGSSSRSRGGGFGK